jgi:hypothetical protein
MNVPSGYTALDLIGFTDKGNYSSSANYVKNDLVHYNNKIWRCLLDDTSNNTPAEGTYWTIFVDSYSQLENLTDVVISSKTAGDVIEYDSTSGKWKNKNTLKSLKTAFDNLGLSVVDGKVCQTYNT